MTIQTTQWATAAGTIIIIIAIATCVLTSHDNEIRSNHDKMLCGDPLSDSHFELKLKATIFVIYLGYILGIQTKYN